MRLFQYFLTVCLLGFSLILQAQIPAKPEPARYVNDYSGILDASKIEELEQKLLSYYKESSNQIVIAITDTLPKAVLLESYATDWFNNWGIGEKDKNNGILLLIVYKERKIKIEVGYGLEATVPDAVAAQIIDQTLTPNFRKSAYTDGIISAVNEFIKATKGEFIKLPNPQKEEFWYYLLPFALVSPIFFYFFRYRSLRNSKTWIPLLVITFIALAILNVILWDKELGLGFIILKNLYNWYYLLIICSALMHLYYLYLGTRIVKDIFYIGQLLIGPLLLLLFWFLIPSIQLISTIPLELSFTVVHLFLFLEWLLFYKQRKSLVAVFTLKNTLTEVFYWDNISPYFTLQSIDAHKKKYRSKMLRTPLIMVNSWYNLSSSIRDVFSYPDKYLKSRADRDFQLLINNYLKIKYEYNDIHRNALDEILNREKSIYEQYAECIEMPSEHTNHYKLSLEFWEEHSNENKEGSFYKRYLKTKALLNESKWLTKSKLYLHPEDLLGPFRASLDEFNRPETLENKETLILQFDKFSALLTKLEKELPKRNDLVLVPAIEQVLNKGVLEDPVFLAAERLKYKELADSESLFFEANANKLLTDAEKQRLISSIEIFTSLFEHPQKLMAYDLAFLKSQYDIALNLNWANYTGKYTESSINSYRVIIGALLKEVEAKKLDTESLSALYRDGILKMATTLIAIQSYSTGSTYSSSTGSTYKSSHSDYSNKKYADYKDYSDYRDKKYSDSSYGGGSSGGGGASGGW